MSYSKKNLVVGKRTSSGVSAIALAYSLGYCEVWVSYRWPKNRKKGGGRLWAGICRESYPKMTRTNSLGSGAEPLWSSSRRLFQRTKRESSTGNCKKNAFFFFFFLKIFEKKRRIPGAFSTLGGYRGGTFFTFFHFFSTFRGLSPSAFPTFPDLQHDLRKPENWGPGPRKPCFFVISRGGRKWGRNWSKLVENGTFWGSGRRFPRLNLSEMGRKWSKMALFGVWGSLIGVW